MMKNVAFQISAVVEKYFPLLQKLSDDDVVYKSSPEKWSRKELIGHLVDSVHNNTRRLIVAQYEENPTILYKQDDWVRINNYQQQPWENIIQLWYYANKQMVFILQNFTDEMFQRTCETSASYTLEWIVADYIKHLLHHLHQVLELEPVAYP